LTERNISHIAKHGVSVKEVEEAIRNRDAIVLKHRSRYALVGSAWGRILFIVLEKVNDEFYVITARDANRKEKKDISWRKVKIVKKIIKFPIYSEEEIKNIEKEFDTKEGWIKANEVFGEDREVESIFISVFLDKNRNNKKEKKNDSK